MLYCPGSLSRIVIVDDEVKLTEILKDFLELRGFEVWTAGTGEGALALLRRHQPTVLLLDLRLRDSGLQGLEGLKQTTALFHHTTVIVISACPDTEMKAEAARLGARRYLEKPLSLPELLSAVREVSAPAAPSS